MASREEILADFQACTGVSDVSQAIAALEEAEWSLQVAVTRILDPSASSEAIDEVEVLHHLETGVEAQVPAVQDDRAEAVVEVESVASSSSARPLVFDVSYNGRCVRLEMNDAESVLRLKQRVERHFGVRVCTQLLSGWRSSIVARDERKLSALKLPTNNQLVLTVNDHLVNGTRNSVNTSKHTHDDTNINGSNNGQEEKEKEVQLIVRHEDEDKTYNLNFSLSKSVLEVKQALASVTNVRVMKQQWSGWPSFTTNELTLHQLGIESGHQLSLKGPATVDMPVIDLASSSMDEDEELADDMMEEDMEESEEFTKSFGMRRIQPLLPEHFSREDGASAAIKFADEFVNRYGEPHPNFFMGELSDAIRDSCSKPPKERKLLALYIHHDSSVLSNVFCTQALCADSIIAFLNENFVLFGWDATFEANRKRLAEMVTNPLGTLAANTIIDMPTDKLPIIAIVCRLRGNTEICQLIHGTVSLDELMSSLLQAQENFSAQLESEIKDEEERERRNAVKREQDLAFEMSLQADREREAQKLREANEQRRKEEEEQRQQSIAQERKLKRKKEAEARLPKEPEGGANGITTIRFRLAHDDEGMSKPPNSRRFWGKDKLSVLLDFLTAHGFDAQDFKAVSSWPRRDVTQLDTEATLESLKLFPQETLTLEEK